jgi:hypothetical protein
MGGYRRCRDGSRAGIRCHDGIAGSIDLISIKQGGRIIGLGLLFGTLIVRLFMTPSIAALLGRWSWSPLRVRSRPIGHQAHGRLGVCVSQTDSHCGGAGLGRNDAAGLAHADPDTEFADQLHTYGIYGQKDQPVVAAADATDDYPIARRMLTTTCTAEQIMAAARDVEPVHYERYTVDYKNHSAQVQRLTQDKMHWFYSLILSSAEPTLRNWQLISPITDVRVAESGQAFFNTKGGPAHHR